MPPRNLKFYLLRFKNASTGELLYRIRQALSALYAKKRRQFLIQGIPSLSIQILDGILLPGLSLKVDQSLVERILAGKTFYLDDDQKSCEEPYDKMLETGPRTDIRSLWEPARLQHLLILLLCSRLDIEQEALFADFVGNEVLKWLDSNPFPCGPHYASAMECGLRIPVFLHILKLLKNLDPEDSRRIAQAIYLHAWWISNRLSLYSSLGNHTIAECAGLVFAGIVFRNSPVGKSWLKTGKAILKQEAYHQILPDGGPAEQSINYHRFVLDLYWYCLDFLEKNGDPELASLMPRLSAGEHFLSVMQTGKADWPALGDSDDGYAVAPGVIPRRMQSDFAPVEHKTFPESGYSVFCTQNGTRLIFDHGPLGMPPLYNHGHADALSIILSKEGLPFLVDPGTYRYNGNPEYRRYFKSTRAHNTVTVDKMDQAVQETGFVWSHAYSSRITRSRIDQNGMMIEAKHDGYAMLKNNVWHSRTILNDHNTFIIKDQFDGVGQHEFELNYHLHPDAEVTFESGWWRIQHGKITLYLTLLKGDSLLPFCGKENPLLGWFSPSYGMKSACSVLQCRKAGHVHAVEFITAICTGDVLSGRELEALACRV